MYNENDTVVSDAFSSLLQAYRYLH